MRLITNPPRTTGHRQAGCGGQQNQADRHLHPAPPPALVASAPAARRPGARLVVAARCARCRGHLVWPRRLAVVAQLAVVALVVSAWSADAQTTQVVALAATVDQLLTNIRNWILGILATLATVFLTIGGVRYVLSAGDPGEVAKAKAAFKSAGFGYALAALAPLLVDILKGIVGA